MTMCNQHRVYLTQSILWKPFERRSLERLAGIYYDCAIEGVNILRGIRVIDLQTYISRPSLACVFRTADVLRRMLYFPEGFTVEVHVLHFGPFCEVKQSM